MLAIVLPESCAPPGIQLGASEYLKWVHGVVAGAPPACDLDAERRLIAALLDAIAAGAIASAHDCSDGGLAVALAECGMMAPDAPFGATIDLSAWAGLPLRALLFGEAQGRVVVSTPDAHAVLTMAARHGVPARVIGTVGRPDGGLEFRVGDQVYAAPVARLAAAYHGAIPSYMARVATATDEDEPILASSH